MTTKLNIDTKAASADAAVQEFRRLVTLIEDLNAIGGARITVSGDINIEIHYEQEPIPDEPS